MMGLADRDYMRDRARARTRKAKGLEALLNLPFTLQSKALVVGIAGVLLSSTLPYRVIAAFAPRGQTGVDDPAFMATAMTQGYMIAALSFLPTIRLLGLLLVAVSGWAMISKRRRYGYNDVFTSATVGVVIGTCALLFTAGSIWKDGLWHKQVARSGRAVTRIATGHDAVGPRIPGAVLPDQTVAREAAVPVRRDIIALPEPELERDRPFPANGTTVTKIPLTGKISSMTFANRSRNNVIALWFYNLGDGTGDKEALRLYVTAGQSAVIRIPSFDYRLALYEAPPSYGLDRGFGPEARMTDLGFIDLKTPDTMLSRLPVESYHGYGLNNFTPGMYNRR